MTHLAADQEHQQSTTRTLYASIRYDERLAEAVIELSVGSRDNSYAAEPALT